MDKINDLNTFYNYEPLKNKKSKSKDLKKPIKSSIFSKEIKNFNEIIEKKEIELTEKLLKEDKEKLEDLLKNIGLQGEKLKRKKSLNDLYLYKKYVKEYIKIFLSIAEDAKKKILWDKNKKQKIAKIHLQIIDNELLELTRIFFNEQHNTMVIAAKLDKIEGLLINLLS